MLKLENNIIRLRAIEPSDEELIFKWENKPAIWRVSNTQVPFSRYIIKQYVENSHQDIYQTKQLRLMIDALDINETVGTIDLFDFDPFNLRAGLGIMIAEQKHRQNGYADNALGLFIDYIGEALGLHQLYCNISKDNTASLKLFEKHSFIICGEKKDWQKIPEGWLNEYILQRIIPD